MKKILSVLLSILLLASFGVVAFAECAHQYTATVYPPTCNERGYNEYICDLCGHSYQDNFVKEAGHFYGEWQTVTTASCTQTGVDMRTCRVCGGVETRTASILNHYDGDDDSQCDTCDYIFEQNDDGGLSPYEWLKLFFANLLAWFRAIFA